MTDRRPMVRMVRTFMHKHPLRERGLASVMAILGPIALLLLIAIVPLHVGSRATMAAQTGPLIVGGYIYSSTGSTVDGASVDVTVFNGTTFKALQSTASDINGFYTVTFGYADWDIGYTVYVVATNNSIVGENSTVVADAFPTIDVKLGTVIPELGGPAATVLTVSGIGMLVVFYARRRGSCPP